MLSTIRNHEHGDCVAMIGVLKLFGLVLGLPAIALGAESCSLAVGEEQPRRPNILFIIVDDQSPLDLRVYNAATRRLHDPWRLWDQPDDGRK